MVFDANIEPRPVPSRVRQKPPIQILLSTMKKAEAERSDLQKQMKAQQKRSDDFIVRMTLQINSMKNSANDDPFVKSLYGALHEKGVELVTYEGEILTEAIEKEADIVEWLPAEDNTEPLVVEALEPEIRYEGRQLHRAKLSCRKTADQMTESGKE